MIEAFFLPIQSGFSIYSAQDFNNLTVILRLMRPAAVHAAFDLPAVLTGHISVCARTVLHKVERAITEQTVKLRHSLMTGIITTVMVFKIFKGILHSCQSACFPSSQKATALAAATLRESTPFLMGIFTV